MKKDKDLQVERKKYNKQCIRERSSLIVACHLPTYGIGYNGDLLFKIKDDLSYFKSKTTNCIIIMGYNTWKSIGSKPLKNRINIVLTRNNIKQVDTETNKDTYVFNDFKPLYRFLKNNYIDKDIYYIGGSEIYKTVVENDLIEYMYITEITKEGDVQHDTVFDYSQFNHFDLYNKSPVLKSDELSYSFCIYKRNI